MKLLKTILNPVLICLFIVLPVCGQTNSSGGLKAILVVGPQQDGTKDAISGMEKLANLLTENGVFVYRFYDKDAIWDEITKVSSECSFFIYSGHGSTLGGNGNVGGICINAMVSTSKLISTLRLKDNSLVIFKSVCNGAGSSASDNGDIGIKEAKTRVTHYAYPFFEVGASAYYANNFGYGAYGFLKDFLSGVFLKQAYLNSTKDWTDVEFEETFPRDSKKHYSIASTPGGGTATRTSYINGVKKVEQFKQPKDYSIAYVGNPEFSISEMK